MNSHGNYSDNTMRVYNCILIYDSRVIDTKIHTPTGHRILGYMPIAIPADTSEVIPTFSVAVDTLRTRCTCKPILGYK